MDVRVTFYKAKCGEIRALVNKRLVATIIPPLAAGKEDYWYKLSFMPNVVKGLSLHAAKRAVIADVEAYYAAKSAPPLEAFAPITSVKGTRPSRSGQNTKRSPKASGASSRRPAVPNWLICPICKAEVKKLPRHVKKVHPESLADLARLLTSAQRPQQRPSRKRVVAKVAKERSITLTPQQIDTLVRRAGAPFHSMARITCDVCARPVLHEFYDRHLKAQHGRHQPPAGRPRLGRTKPKPQLKADFVDDATKDYATLRERGRFGSHPAHDGYSDHDKP